MTTTTRTRSMSGGQVVVECLRNEGVEHVFTVPGESYLSIMDAIRDSERIRLVSCRHEGGACLMAEAYAKATRRPAVCMVSRGPGATHASDGVFVARYDSTPLVLLVGQVPRALRGREAGQEIDYTHLFGGIAKWVVEVSDPSWLPDAVSRAFHVARSGRPGPVVVSLPRDVLEHTTVANAVAAYPPVWAHPAPALVATLVERIGAASKPIIMVGSGVEYADAWQELIRFSEKFQIPVVAAHRRMSAFPNDHAHYLGYISGGAKAEFSGARSYGRDALSEADLVVAVGTRLNAHSTVGFALPHAGQSLVQIYSSAEMIGQNHRPELGIVADIKLALTAALTHPAPAPDRDRQVWIDDYRARQVAWATPPSRPTRHVSMEQVMRDVKTSVPRDTIHTSDAGNFDGWVHKYLEFTAPNTFLGPTAGCMGYGVPGAVAAKLACPDRVVMAHCGDGGFMMTGQELVTAVQLGISIIVVVYNNGSLATIRMHQETQYPERPVGTDLVNPDFTAVGNAYGALGLKVMRDEEFLPALQQALNAGRCALIEVLTDLEFVSPSATLTQISADGAARLGQPV